jgi:hypothetical protein
MSFCEKYSLSKIINIPVVALKLGYKGALRDIIILLEFQISNVHFEININFLCDIYLLLGPI